MGVVQMLEKLIDVGAGKIANEASSRSMLLQVELVMEIESVNRIINIISYALLK